VNQVPDPGELFALMGEEGFQRLIAAFYRRVPDDPILGPMYPADDMEGAEARLRDFLVYRCGGPDRYIQERGHPRLRRRHFPFAIDQAARDRWIELMEAALAECELPAEATQVLRPFFAHVASFLINR